MPGANEHRAVIFHERGAIPDLSNTNYTFQGVTFEMATGYKQVTGVGAASVVDAQYDIGKFHIPTAFQFSGVGSAINAAEIGVGYDLIDYYDTVLEANLLAGYDWDVRTVEIEPKIDIKKKDDAEHLHGIGHFLAHLFSPKIQQHTELLY